MDDPTKFEVETHSMTRSASVMFDILDPNDHQTYTLYKCDECKALLCGGEDAREHLWWHDLLVQTPR
jgi:hypothetical protein